MNIATRWVAGAHFTSTAVLGLAYKYKSIRILHIELHTLGAINISLKFSDRVTVRHFGAPCYGVFNYS